MCGCAFLPGLPTPLVQELNGGTVHTAICKTVKSKGMYELEIVYSMPALSTVKYIELEYIL